MRPPQLYAVSFGPPDGGWSEDGGDRYSRLSRVLAYTAQQHCQGWQIHVGHETTTPPDLSSAMGNPSHVWNTQKLDLWRQAVMQAQDGDRLLLLDADMMILRSLDSLWDQGFDLAYTVRQSNRLPFNGGVLALRVSDRTRGFMDRWAEANRRFLGDAKAHQIWRAKYAGINQSSFGYMLDVDRHRCQLRTLPCVEWNNCGPKEWALFDPTVTRIVHLKSRLRKALFGLLPMERVHRPFVKIWHRLEAQAQSTEVHA